MMLTDKDPVSDATLTPHVEQYCITKAGKLGFQLERIIFDRIKSGRSPKDYEFLKAFVFEESSLSQREHFKTGSHDFLPELDKLISGLTSVFKFVIYNVPPPNTITL